MKKITLTLIAIATLASCNSLNTEHCHLTAKEYIRGKGFEIDTAYYSKYTTTIITKDSCVIMVNSQSFSYPYVSNYKVVRDFSNRY